VLLDGQAEATDGDRGARPLVAPATIAFEEFLQNRPAADQVRATDVAVLLVINDDELRTLLSDSTDLVEGLFRTLVAAGLVAPQGFRPGEHVDVLAPTDSTPLSPLDKSFVLHRLAAFFDVSAEEALQLAGIARDIVADAGDVVSGPADPTAICILLSGEMALEVSDRSHEAPITVQGGDVVGLYETLAGVPLGRIQRVVRRTRALRIEREDLFDLLGQRPALLQQLLGTLFDPPSLRLRQRSK
jgi:hypothetical protein